MNEILRVEDLAVYYPQRGGVLGRVADYVRAVRGVDFSLSTGEILAVVGESGCGKSTLASALVGLAPWQPGGKLVVDGTAYSVKETETFRHLRTKVQMVFQDPFSSLNPRQTVQEILTYPVLARGVSAVDARKRMAKVLDQVGLAAVDAGRFPHAFSGGQRQRIGIARALMLEPRILICDEVTSALDVSVQAQILSLIEELRSQLGLSVLFISHDLSVVRALADRALVMYQGEVVESGDVSSLFDAPAHPYARALLDSVPTLDRTSPPRILPTESLGAAIAKEGCRFRHRCPFAMTDCQVEVPLRRYRNRLVRCQHPMDASGGILARQE